MASLSLHAMPSEPLLFPTALLTGLSRMVPFPSLHQQSVDYDCDEAAALSRGISAKDLCQFSPHCICETK
jgi:hypothetical protein